MIQVSDKFKQALANDERIFRTYADFVLANGTEVSIQPESVWGNGLVINDAVSSDTQLEIGSAIINAATLVLININDEFTPYTFEGATATIYVALEFSDGTEERVKKGVYTVDSCDYTTDLITINMLDNMAKFDVSYESSSLSGTPHLYNIVSEACTNCGVTLATTSFTNESFAVQEYDSIDKSQYTYRDMISFAAQCAGLNAMINNDGELELKWYDTGSLVGTMNGLDGGQFGSDLPFGQEVTNTAASTTSDTFYTGFFRQGGVHYDTITYTGVTKTAGASQINYGLRLAWGSVGSISFFSPLQNNRAHTISSVTYGYGTYSGGQYLKIRIKGGFGTGTSVQYVVEVYFTESEQVVIWVQSSAKIAMDGTSYVYALNNGGGVHWSDFVSETPYAYVYSGSSWKQSDYASGDALDGNNSATDDDGFPINQRNGMVKVSNIYVATNASNEQEPRYIVRYATGIHSNISAYANRFSNGFGLHANMNTQVYFELTASLTNYTYLYTTAFYFQKGACDKYGEFCKYRYEGAVVADADADTFDYYALTDAQKSGQTVIIEFFYLSDGTELYVVPIQMPETGEFTVTARTAPYATSTTQTVSGISRQSMGITKVSANSTATATLSTGNADGGNVGSGYTDPIAGCHTIDACYSTKYSKDDITITGARVVVEREVEVDGSTESRTVVFESGSSDYMIEISDNPLIPTASDDDAQFIADLLGLRLIGMTFRTATLTHASDPTIESGDVAIAMDRKGRAHPILVCSTTFSSSAAQNTQCSAESVSDNRANRKTASESLYDKVIDTVNKLIASNKGAGLADYVIEKGTSGSWYYQKWNSGKIEAWFSSSVSTGSSWTAAGNVYRATWSTTIPGDVGFASAPNTLISFGADAQSIFAITGGATSKTAISGHAFRGGSASSSSSITISIYAWSV